jgi:hypothetical protein
MIVNRRVTPRGPRPRGAPWRESLGLASRLRCWVGMRHRTLIAVIHRVSAALLLCAGACGSGTIEVGPDAGRHGEPPPASDHDASAASDDGCALPEGPPAKEAFFTADLPDGDSTIEDGTATAEEPP